MELVEALKQLSLHVRSGQGEPNSANTSNHWADPHDQPTSHQHQQSSSATSKSWPYKDGILDTEIRQQQLEEFNNSVETLFSQITDLDLAPISVVACNRVTRLNAQIRETNLNQTSKNRVPPELAYLGDSIETSQEEDSDNSSQQSGYATSSGQQQQQQHAYHTSPFVRHLLKRDLGAITDAVRKIGRILAIGKEIESIYQSIILFGAQFASNNIQEIQKIYLSYSRSLCNAFISLCSTEPYICDLSTITRYNELCQLLLNQLDRLNLHSTVVLNGATNQPNIVGDTCETIESAMSDSDETMCLDSVRDALDFALLECEQSTLIDKWTENKLYVQTSTRFSR